jgi:tripartite-type tricarboxylate transporter receptor subunit TctC
MNPSTTSQAQPAMSRCGMAVMAVAALALAAPVAAQDYPKRPVRVIVPQSAGGSTDLVARIITPRLDEALKQPVIVDNRPGAGSINGTDMAAKATPDGHTLLAVAASFTITPNVRKKLPFDPARDFAPVTQLVVLPHVLVLHPSVQAKSVKEFIALAKAKPGALNVAVSGVGTSTHLAAEQFMYQTGTKLLVVPYKGGAPGTAALLGGEVQLSFATISTALPHIKSGKLRALAVTSAKRSSVAPELPTVSEAGVPGYEHSSWVGVLAPAKTPPAIVNRLHSEIARIVQMEEVKTMFLREGLEAIGNSPKEFGAIIHGEIDKWAKLVKLAGIPVE